MKAKFEAVVRIRKRNLVFKQETGRITHVKLSKFAGKRVEVQVREIGEKA